MNLLWLFSFLLFLCLLPALASSLTSPCTNILGSEQAWAYAVLSPTCAWCVRAIGQLSLSSFTPLHHILLRQDLALCFRNPRVCPCPSPILQQRGYGYADLLLLGSAEIFLFPYRFSQRTISPAPDFEFTVTLKVLSSQACASTPLCPKAQLKFSPLHVYCPPSRPVYQKCVKKEKPFLQQASCSHLSINSIQR